MRKSGRKTDSVPEKRLPSEIRTLRAEVKRLRDTLFSLTPSVEVLLRRRGFRIYRKEPVDDLLLPAEKYITRFYGMMNKYSFRLFLRDVIKNKDSFSLEKVTRYATPDVTRRYMDFLEAAGLVSRDNETYSIKRKSLKNFGPTLEWFLAEIMKREFSAQAIWGVKFKRPMVGGDYDLLVKIDGAILYMEVKSSPPKQIYANEISAFLDRVSDLAPEISVFFMDTELRMKDKIVPMFEEELAKRHLSPPPVLRIEKELFGISDKIFIINAKDSIINNIERVLIRFFRRE